MVFFRIKTDGMDNPCISRKGYTFPLSNFMFQIYGDKTLDAKIILNIDTSSELTILVRVIIKD